MNANSRQKHFHEILNDFSNAMLTTVGSDGRPRSRPMRVAEVGDQNELWFVTGKDSGKLDEIESNSTVAITMQGGGKYLSLTGQAETTADRTRIDELWSEAWKIWFPNGKDDPDIILLKIVPEEGEYWDMGGTNRLRYMYEAGKAYFSGTEIDVSRLDLNARVDF